MISDVQAQRAKPSFDTQKLAHLIHGRENYEYMTAVMNDFTDAISYDLNVYGLGRVEMIKQSIRTASHTLNTLEPGSDKTYVPTVLHDQFQMPYSLHIGMFINCIKMLGTESQAAQLLPKCASLQITGCYAQTQIGHGSDVQGLETTAEFDKNTDQFVLNSPTITSAKFWPGDLGIYANHAIVFAKLLVAGQSYGVHSFVVRIRDQNHKLLPGVEAGDLGPKFGFTTKDNGYMILKQVRIPRKSMLRRYVSLSREGELKLKGSPKISYATMMNIRRSISCGMTKALGSSISIAGKYSLMRKQFKDDLGKEIPIIQYQLQQNKLTSCLADFYAICAGSLKVQKIVDKNFKLVTENDDDSLMSETHVCLCLSKALWTDTVLKDMEVCRLACGGHGFSHYSGLPIAIQSFSPNVTLEGENTVLMLQLARYLIKAYRNCKSKKKPLSDSVKYLQFSDFFMSHMCSVSENKPNQWNIESVRLILAQSVCHLLEKINDKFVEHQGKNAKSTQNSHAALRMYQAAVMHSIYYTYVSFEQMAVTFSDEIGRTALLDLCLLYGINAVLTRSGPIIESGKIQPHHLSSLQQRKQHLLKQIRPHFYSLIEGMGIPDDCLKSAFVGGTNIYEVTLNLIQLYLKITEYVKPRPQKFSKRGNQPRSLDSQNFAHTYEADALILYLLNNCFLT